MKIWKKIIIFWGKCRLTLKGIAMCKSRIRTCVLHNKLVLSSLIEILHFMIIDCSSGWINEYYIFWMYQHHMFWYRKSFAIQEEFCNSDISLFYQEPMTRYKKSNLMYRIMTSNPFWCLYSSLNEKLHFKYCFYVW